jgi:acetyltransferase-like isoleucine patch superfamily enzyme
LPISDDAEIAPDAEVLYPALVNLYGCRIGSGTRVGPFVEIQKDVTIGRACKIQSHSFICSGVTILDEVFVGHGVLFINDRHPRAAVGGRLAGTSDWNSEPTLVKAGASIGSGAVIMCGVTIGERAMIGAGAVVTRSVADDEVVAGVPARPLQRRRAR